MSFAEGESKDFPKKLSALNPLHMLEEVYKFFGDEWMKLSYFQYLKKEKELNLVQIHVLYYFKQCSSKLENLFEVVSTSCLVLILNEMPTSM